MILTRRLKGILRWIKENCYPNTVVPDCVTGNSMMLGFYLAMKFPVGVKIWKKDDTMDKLNVCGTQKIPHGMPLSVSGNGAARISLEWKHPMRRLQFFIFAEHSRAYSPSSSILLAVQSLKWSIEKKRAEMSQRRWTFVCIIRSDEMRT